MISITDAVQFYKYCKGPDDRKVKMVIDFDYTDIETRRQLEEAANAFFERANEILAGSEN